MKILGIIPARGGSKGVPKKNIKLLAGKPLIQYTSEIALRSKYLSKVILSSDDDEIIKVAGNMGIESPFIRPKHLAGDNSPTIKVVQHALEFYKEQGEFFDAVCLLQVTSPFRTLQLLNNAIERFILKKTDSLVSVLEVPHVFNPHWTFEANENDNLKLATGEKNIITRRQELPKAFIRDGSIYITKTDIVVNDNSLYGNTIAYIESPKERYVNIDTMEDWEIAENMLKSL